MLVKKIHILLSCNVTENGAKKDRRTSVMILSIFQTSNPMLSHKERLYYLKLYTFLCYLSVSVLYLICGLPE